MSKHIQGSVATDEPDRYIRRLCKHFGHKLETEWDEQQGRVQFAMGSCYLQARAGELEVECRADNQQDLDIVADCIKDHFDRFAVKEQLVLEWD